jgi:hypothetical protein
MFLREISGIIPVSALIEYRMDTLEFVSLRRYWPSLVILADPICWVQTPSD